MYIVNILMYYTKLKISKCVNVKFSGCTIFFARFLTQSKGTTTKMSSDDC